jgi:aspartate kinase
MEDIVANTKRKVFKFGGTSLANAANIMRCVEISKDADYVVVSAPGKRHPKDAKITESLLSLPKLGAELREETIRGIETRYAEIISDLSIDLDLTQDFDEIRKRAHDVASTDFIASRGEYLMARIFAVKTGRTFVDATFISFKKDGSVSISKTKSAARKIGIPTHSVIPGFYGSMPDGAIKILPRGGSDLSGAYVALVTKSDVYVNYTDTDGVLATDPRIVSYAEGISVLCYREVRELAYRGAGVLHYDTLAVFAGVSIPIVVKNTFNPKHRGTLIVRDATPYRESERTAVGVSRRNGLATILIEIPGMNENDRFLLQCIPILKKKGLLNIFHMPSGLDGMTFVVESEKLLRTQNMLEEILRKKFKPERLAFEHGIAIVCVVGEKMKDHPGILAKAAGAISSKRVNIEFADQGIDQICMVLGVKECHSDTAARALYEAFFPDWD